MMPVFVFVRIESGSEIMYLICANQTFVIIMPLIARILLQQSNHRLDTARNRVILSVVHLLRYTTCFLYTLSVFVGIPLRYIM